MQQLIRNLMEGADKSPMTPIQRKCERLVYTMAGIIFLICALEHHAKKLFNDKKRDQVPPAAIKTPAQASPSANPTPLYPPMIPTGQ